jgi:hypothetical protein
MANRSPYSSKLRVLFVDTATRPALGAELGVTGNVIFTGLRGRS